MDLYNALIKLRPEWADDPVAAVCDRRASENGEANSDGHRPPLQSRNTTLKVVMTGSAEDGPEWQKHIGNKKQRRDLANQFKDAKNPFKIVIVRDMWLSCCVRNGCELR